MDKLLQWIVEQVEKETLTEGLITVVVPGGIFSGELIPTWRFVQIMGDSLHRESKTSRPNGGSKKRGGAGDVPREPVIDSEYIHLLAPIVLNSMSESDKPLVMPALRLRIDSISGWVSGGIRGSTQD